jgi:hypothetical protein
MSGFGSNTEFSAAPAPSGGWQPIETAPKDGTRILGFRSGWAEAIGVAFWRCDWEEWRSVPGDYSWNLTHWMPLPEPPK